MSVVTPKIESMNGAFDVSGYNVVVTGGNRGIGFGIATAFAQSGANVAILCRDEKKGAEALAELKTYGGNHYCFSCDVSSLDSVRAAAAKIYEVFDNVNVLVNNAGIGPVTKMLEDPDLTAWHQTFNTNLHGPANTIHTFVPKMVEAGRGCVINISSIGGQNVSDAGSHPKPAYHSGKAALDVLTRYLAVELGGTGVRFNVIAPGLTHSELDQFLPASIHDLVNNELPVRRFAEPIEVGAYAVFLASPAGSNITGAICVHDGGKLQIK